MTQKTDVKRDLDEAVELMKKTVKLLNGLLPHFESGRISQSMEAYPAFEGRARTAEIVAFARAAHAATSALCWKATLHANVPEPDAV